MSASWERRSSLGADTKRISNNAPAGEKEKEKSAKRSFLAQRRRRLSPQRWLRVCFPPRLALKLKGQQVWWDSTWLSLKTPWSAWRFRSHSALLYFIKWPSLARSTRLAVEYFNHESSKAIISQWLHIIRPSSENTLLESRDSKRAADISFRKSADELHSTDFYFLCLQTPGQPADQPSDACEHWRADIFMYYHKLV